MQNGDAWTCLLHLQFPMSPHFWMMLKYLFLQNHMKLVQSLRQLMPMNLNNLNTMVMPTWIRTVMSLQLSSFHLLLWHLPLLLLPSLQLFLINFLQLNNLHLIYLHNNLQYQWLRRFSNEEIDWIVKRPCPFSLVPTDVNNETMMGLMPDQTMPRTWQTLRFRSKISALMDFLLIGASRPKLVSLSYNLGPSTEIFGKLKLDACCDTMSNHGKHCLIQQASRTFPFLLRNWMTSV